MKEVLNSISNCILPAIILIILFSGFIKKVPVYESFTEGAKEGFKISIQIIPYLVAIMAAVSMLRFNFKRASRSFKNPRRHASFNANPLAIRRSNPWDIFRHC